MTHIVFLRGINVGGHKKIKMADLRERLLAIGFVNVQTYIQSGNIVLNTTKTKNEIAALIKKDLHEGFGFDVPVLVMAAEEIEAILKHNPFASEAISKNLYFALLHNAPEPENNGRLKAADYPNEAFEITDNCVYLNCKIGAGKAKLSNNVIEQKLMVTATTRNLRTLQKMVELAR
ncbi:MAG: DUF1697 domain-containing protein [Allomuricauda sp.]|nr:MAG: DUF1697 domain-containing protein [Allomuricauda sp.]